MYLWLTQDGSVRYKRVQGGVHTPIAFVAFVGRFVQDAACAAPRTLRAASRSFPAAHGKRDWRLYVSHLALLALCLLAGVSLLSGCDTAAQIKEGITHSTAIAAEIEREVGKKPQIFSHEYKSLFSWLIAHGANPGAVDKDGQDGVLHRLEHDHEAMAEWVRTNGV